MPKRHNPSGRMPPSNIDNDVAPSEGHSPENNPMIPDLYALGAICDPNQTPHLNQHNEPTILAMYAEKGGVAKTTGALSLSHILARDFGLKVLLYDVDGQRSATMLALSNRIHFDPRAKGDYHRFLQQHNQQEGRRRPATLFEQLLPLTKGHNPEHLEPAQAITLWEGARNNIGRVYKRWRDIDGDVDTFVLCMLY